MYLSLFSVVLSGQRPPVALLILCHILHCGYTSEPPHCLRSPEAVSSRTMADDQCHSTCYLDSSSCHPTACCWCTIQVLGCSTLQCRSRSGLLHSQVCFLFLGVQNKDSCRPERCLLSIRLHSARCDCDCLVPHVWWTGHSSSVGQLCSSHLHHSRSLLDSKTSTPLLCHRRSCTPTHALERQQSHNLHWLQVHRPWFHWPSTVPVVVGRWSRAHSCWCGPLSWVPSVRSAPPPAHRRTGELPPPPWAHCVSSTSPTVPLSCGWICGSRSQRLFLGEPQGALLSLLSGGAVLGGVGAGWLLHTC